MNIIISDHTGSQILNHFNQSADGSMDDQTPKFGRRKITKF